MATIPLSLLKKHVRADDFDTDDEKLQLYLDAAEEQVVLATNRTADELMKMGGYADGRLVVRQRGRNARRAAARSSLRRVGTGETVCQDTPL